MAGVKRQQGRRPGQSGKAHAVPRSSSKRAAPMPAKASPSRRPAVKPVQRTTKPTTPAVKPAARAAPPSRGKAGSNATAAQPLRRASGQSFGLSRLHQVALLATDLDASVAFYRDVLGLRYMDRYDPPGLAFFSLGNGVRLILSATSSGASLYFLVDDIDAAVRVLTQRGVSFLHKPMMIHRDDEGRLGKKGVEEWMAFFKDPSGNLLALVAQR